MRIVHICISSPYIDGWGYQENLLPAYLQDIGVDDCVVAPIDNFPSYVKSSDIDEIRAKGSDYSYEGVRVLRIPTVKVSTSLLFTKGLFGVLEKIKPDAIFHHNFNCSSLVVAARYSKRHSIPLLVDNHADEINMTSKHLWAFIYYKCLIKSVCRLYRSAMFKAYGVTMSRCDFIKKYYGVPNSKIDFLPIGADSKLAAQLPSVINIREEYGFTDDDRIIVSGGKMGIGKGTHYLIKAVDSLRSHFPSLKLVLFGKFEDDETETLAKNSPFIKVEGWCDRETTLKLLKMADVACWPVHHTTLVEDAISVGTPLILRKTRTTAHLIDGNGVWIDTPDSASIETAISIIIEDAGSVIKDACLAMMNNLDYKTIAKKMVSDIYGFEK